MSKVQAVEKFIKSIFDRYGMSDYGFFIDTDDDEPWDVVPVALFENGEIEEEVLQKVSLKTGFSRNELLSLDEKVGEKYLRKFPFFKYLIAYKITLNWDENHKDSLEELFKKKIIRSSRDVHDDGGRYSEEAILKRLVIQLKEMDRLFPGTWHENGKLVDVKWYTDSLTNYGNCTALLKSFLETVEYYKYLFFKILKTDLKGIEASDFNFLTSALRVVDIIAPTLEINTQTMRNLRRIYNEEGYKDLMSYIRFNVFNEIEPWRCVDFTKNMKLAQEYINYHREGKKAFIEFARTVGKIHCYYSWSDDLEKADSYIDFDGEEMKDYISEEIYLDKTSEETAGWEDAMERLMEAAASESKGGLKRPKREYSPYLIPSSMRMERALRRSNAERGVLNEDVSSNEGIEHLKEVERKLRERNPEDYDENGVRIPRMGEDIGFDLPSIRERESGRGGPDDE